MQSFAGVDLHKQSIANGGFEETGSVLAAALCQ